MIPKIIHHVWPGDDSFKEKFHDFRLSWMRHHPDWTFMFWRLDNLPKAVPNKVLDILNDDHYSYTVKSDLLRFTILAIYGGIYVDTDMECLKPFDEFLSYDLFTGEEDLVRVCPSLIGCTPNNQIMAKVMMESIKTIKSVSYQVANKQPDVYSGVDPFTKIIKDTNTKVFDSSYFYPVHYTERDQLNKEFNSYAKHYWSGKDDDGWCNKEY